MGNMKEIGLLDCEDRPSIEENFKRVQGGGGVSSWNDLTDKPFYENAELLYSAENVEFPYDMDFTLILPKLLGIVPGETYDVIWDGKKYSCTAVSIDVEGVTVLLLGNKVQLGIDTGEPFMYTEIPDQGMAGIGDIASVMSGASESTYHSFSISSIKIKKLDPKFYDRPCYEEFTSFYSGTLTESVKVADGVYQYPVIKIVDGSPVGIEVPLTEGETVKITINGVAEEKVVKKRNNNYNQFYIGNEAFYVNSGETEDTGEGYCFMYDPELTPYTSIFTSSNKGYYSINLERTTITPLPVKFLPPGIGGGGEVVLINMGGEKYETGESFTYEEAKELYDKWVEGKARVLVCSGVGLASGASEEKNEILAFQKSAADSDGSTYDLNIHFYNMSTDKVEFRTIATPNS